MKTTADLDTISELSKSVELKLGFDITSTRDCEVLAMELERFDRRFSLSVSTLRRFFGLIPKKSEYSLSTLNSLARFTGFTSFKNWEESRASFPVIEKIESQKITVKSNSQTVSDIIESLDDMIETLLRNPSLRLSAAQLKSTRESAITLYKLNAMPEWLWKKANRHPIVRLLFEYFPPLDYLNTFGADLMRDYYETSNSLQEKMFSLGLLTISQLYQAKETAKTFKTLPPVLELTQAIHPMPQARILGLHLLAQSEGIETEVNTAPNFRTLIFEGINNEEAIWPRWAVTTCPFIFKIIEWVTLANDKSLCEEAILGIQNYRTRQDFATRQFSVDNIMDLRLSWCYYLTERELEAKALLDSVSPDRFPAHEERTLGIWYYSLLEKIGSSKRRKSNLILLDLLTSQTGYIGLSSRLNQLTP
ncbi:MAG: hypothetical protein CL823_05955 [Crocinitomicaceae bacterium]|nr:hypothetical protein [Crocinitomicaceae bacterium]|tara:strand:- start:1870 stop:3129 length:1260 start_codon:yes stop_codon:yes gene_type:complete